MCELMKAMNYFVPADRNIELERSKETGNRVLVISHTISQRVAKLLLAAKNKRKLRKQACPPLTEAARGDPGRTTLEWSNLCN